MSEQDIREARKAADDNLHRNSGRDLAEFEGAVDLAERHG